VSSEGRALGFTLVEVLVAFAAVALVLTVGFELLVGAARGTAAAELRQRAHMVAEAVLAEAELDLRSHAGSSTGRIDNVTWQREVGPYHGVKASSPGAASLLHPYEIRVTARWPGGSLTLTRLALASAE